MRAKTTPMSDREPPEQGSSARREEVGVEGGRGVGVGEIIRRRRGELGMSLSRLAGLAGCAKGYLSEIENGRRAKAPGAGLLAQLESVLGLADGELARAAAWESAPEALRERVAAADARAAAAGRLALLLGGPARAGGGRSLDVMYKSGVLRALAESVDPEGGIAGTGGKDGTRGDVVPVGGAGGGRGRGIPIINSVAAGYPAEFTDLGYPARVADAYLSVGGMGVVGGAEDPDAFAARVVGDSMEPEYREGDIVVFSPAQVVRDGDDCFVRLEPDHEATFKRVFFEKLGEAGKEGKEGNGGEVGVRIRLEPLNAGKYVARVVDREQVAGLYAAVSVTRAVGGGGGGGRRGE